MYDKFTELLKKVKYNPANDKLILLGDYIDRGPHSKKVIELVMDLVANGAVALMGNHEDMLIKAIEDADDCMLWLQNGGKSTLRSYRISGGYGSTPWYGLPKLIPQKHIEFLKGLPKWYETDEYVFVHAGLPFGCNHPKDADEESLMWVRQEWLINQNKGKTVIFGHTPTFTIVGHESSVPWFSSGKVGIDTGAVFKDYGGKLTCLQLPAMVWQA